MERDAIRLLYEWNARANRKSLIICGARQVDMPHVCLLPADYTEVLVDNN